MDFTYWKNLPKRRCGKNSFVQAEYNEYNWNKILWEEAKLNICGVSETLDLGAWNDEVKYGVKVDGLCRR